MNGEQMTIPGAMPVPTDGLEDLVGRDELLAALKPYRITDAWLRRETKAGTIPFTEIGVVKLYSLQAVKAEILDRARRKPEPKAS